MFSSSPTLSIHLSNPRQNYIPHDTLTGHILLKTPPTSPVDLTSLGITFRATESVRYNSYFDETLLFNYPLTLFQGPYTLPENREYVYPFEFEFPETTDPPGPEEKILRPAVRGAGRLFEAKIKHRLPPSTEHNRPGVSYSFDAEVKYELYAWVMKKKLLGSGEKVSVECQEELKFLPTDRESEGLKGRYFNCRCVEMVGVGSDGEKGVVEEEEEKQHGRFSKLLSSKTKQNPSSSSTAVHRPTEMIEINIQAPNLLIRNTPNPFLLSGTLRGKALPATIKLHSLTVELKSTVHVPCMQRTVYGAKAGVGEEVQTLSLLSEEDYNSPLKIPPEDGVASPLSLPLFLTPHHQLPMYTFDFKTFKIARTHSLSFKARFSCGGRDQGFEFEQREFPLMVPFPSSRAPETERELSEEEAGESGSGSGWGRKAAWEEKGKEKEEAEARVNKDEPPPLYKG